jgi:hypothetical protein
MSCASKNKNCGSQSFRNYDFGVLQLTFIFLKCLVVNITVPQKKRKICYEAERLLDFHEGR